MTAPAAPRVSTARLLLYGLTTTPHPIAVSPTSGDPRKALLAVTLIRRAQDPVQCREIKVTLPVGESAAHLATTMTGVTAAADRDGWHSTVGPFGDVVFTPSGGLDDIALDTGLTLSVGDVPVNRTVGRAVVRVTATVRRSAVPDDPWTEEEVTLPVSKFPPTFHLGNLVAHPLRVQQGGSSTLSWDAEGGSFGLRYPGADIDVTGRTEFVLHNIGSDLVVELHGSASSPSGELEAVRTVLLTVDRPNIVTPSLTVETGVVTDNLVGYDTPLPILPAGGFVHRPELSMRRYDLRAGTWTRLVPLDIAPVGAPPAIAVHDGLLHLVYRPHDVDVLAWATFDGRIWRHQSASPGRAAVESPISLTSMGGQLACARVDHAGKQRYSVTTSATAWGPETDMPAPDLGGVSLAWDGTRMNAVMRKYGVGGSEEFGWTIHRRGSDGAWTEHAAHVPTPPSGGDAELLAYSGKLGYVARVRGGDTVLYEYPAGSTVPTPIGTPLRAATDPRATTHGTDLYALATDPDGLLWLTTHREGAWSPATLVDGCASRETPTIAVLGNELIAIGRGAAFETP
ncbi:hypothetical protein B4N89_29875 [Embleya scabrispora]|uniref:Uncharacterized protein n=1 Tax=Embleya scabrispora TaxID=159449 RepID=A0A1T3P6D9_9ACTN|nr:hypothetical protein [Embleya scabrispora]OPC84572.1 hypothetical protein B4N89_29875 [Embleya scabrispora]